MDIKAINHNNLGWDKKIYVNFIQKRKRVNWIGYEFKGVFTTFGKSFLLSDSMCVQIKRKKRTSVNTVLRFRRVTGSNYQGYYYNFLMYFVKLGWFRINKKIYNRNVLLSRITAKRLKK